MRNKKYGPCKIIKKINNKAYVVDLLENLGISSTFNVAYIFEYFLPEDSDSNLRTSCFQERETDVRQFTPGHSTQESASQPDITLGSQPLNRT